MHGLFPNQLKLTFALTFLSLVAVSQSFPKESIVSSYVYDLKAIYAADVDNDQLIDLVSCSSEDDHNVSWYKNLGNGSYSQQKVISNDVNRPTAVYVADLDGDGKPDVISASTSDQKLAWYKNLGNGMFGVQDTIADSLYGIDYINVKDMDGDNDLDIITMSGTPQTDVYWYRNNGKGQFDTAYTIYSKIENLIIDAADLDSDNDVDILMYLDSRDDIIWYENDGKGNLDSTHTITTYYPHATSLVCTDMNGDGDIDILASNGTGSHVSDEILWYENTGNKKFSTKKSIDSKAIKLNQAFAEDMDADGDIDVLATGYNSYQMVWYENTGSNTYAVKDTIYDSYMSPLKSVIADIDGDSKPDVVTAFTSLSKLDHIGWVANQGSGNFSDVKHAVSSSRGVSTVHASDIDGDGDLDIVSGSYSDSKVAWYENLGHGEFSAIHIISRDVLYIYCVYSADMDGDGDMDVLSASGGDSKIAWYENLGGGNFASQDIISSTASGARRVYAADLDGDGDLDVLSASRSNDNIDWYENLGNGNFSSTKVIDNWADGAFGVYAADLDLDGDLDVLSAADNDDELKWYENLGNGSFSAGTRVGLLNNAKNVFAADLDGDGDLDVLGAASKEMVWYENIDSASSFSLKKQFPGSSSSTSLISEIYATDIDMDGDIDVFGASTGSNNIKFYENLDTGNFAWAQGLLISLDASSVFGGDIDGDGDEDIISGAYQDSRVTWHENALIRKFEYNYASCDSSQYLSPSGRVLTKSGTYYDTIPNTFGGDSIITLHLRLNAKDTVLNKTSICMGDTLFVGNSKYTQTGVYYDSLSSSFGCDSMVISDLDVISIDTSLNWTNRTWALNKIEPGMNFQWIDCMTGQAIQGERSPSFTPSKNGSYAVVITYEGCVDTSSCHVVADFSKGEHEIFGLNLYPNPTSDRLQVKWFYESSSMQIRLTDLSGRTYFVDVVDGASSYTLDLSHLAAGIYLIEFQQGDHRSVERVVKK